MKKTILVAVAAAMFVFLVAGVAIAATGQCTENPCEVPTEQNDQVIEQRGDGVDDVINALNGDDVVDASEFDRDEDRLSGGRGNDRLRTDDGDGRDFVTCGKGNEDVAIVDNGDRVDRKNCEDIRYV